MQRKLAERNPLAPHPRSLDKSRATRPGGGLKATQPIEAQTVRDNDQRLEQLGLDAEQRDLLAQHGETQAALNALFGGHPPQVGLAKDSQQRPMLEIHGNPPGPIVQALADIGEVLAQQGMHAAALPYLAAVAGTLRDAQAQCLPVHLCLDLLSQARTRLPLNSFMALREQALTLVQQGHLGIECVDRFEDIGEQQYGTALRAQSAHALLRLWQQQKGPRQTAILDRLKELVKELNQRLEGAAPEDLQIHLELLKALWRELSHGTGGAARDFLLPAVWLAVDTTVQWLTQSDRSPPNEPELLHRCAHFYGQIEIFPYARLSAPQRDVLCTRAMALLAEGRLPVDTLEKLVRMVDQLAALSAPGCELLLASIRYRIDHLDDHPFFERETLIWGLCERLAVVSEKLAKRESSTDNASEIAIDLMQQLIDHCEVALTQDALKSRLQGMLETFEATQVAATRHSAMYELLDGMDWYADPTDLPSAVERYQQRLDASDPVLSSQRYRRLRDYVLACARAGMPERMLKNQVEFSAQVFPEQHEPELLALALLAQATLPQNRTLDAYLNMASEHPEPRKTFFSPAGLRQLARTCAHMPPPPLNRPYVEVKHQLQEVIDWAVKRGHVTAEEGKRCWLWFYLEKARCVLVSTHPVESWQHAERSFGQWRRRATSRSVRLGAFWVAPDASPLIELANKLLLPLANKKDRLEFFQLALRCDSQVAGRLLRSYWKCRPIRADRSTDAQNRSGPLGSFVQDLGEALEQQTWELHEPTHQAAFDVDAMPEWDLLTQGLLDLAFHGVSAAQWDPAMPSFIVNLALRQSRWELRQRSGQALMTALLHTLALKDKAEPHTVLNVLIHRLLGGLDPAVPPIDPHRGAMAAATLLAVLEQHDRPLAERLITGHLHRHPLAGVYLGMARTHLALGEGRHAEAQGHWYATERQLGTEQEKPELALPDELRAPFESLRQQVQALSESERTHAAHPLSLAAGPGG